MYLFKDVDKNYYLPSGSSFGMIFNNVDIEQTFNIVCLEVTGRHFIEHDIQYTKSVYTDGGRLTSNTTEPRYITVQIYIKHDESDVMDIMNKLSGFLSRYREPVPIQFRDELDYTYYGIFKSADFEVDNVRGIRIINLDFICPDPFVYKKTDTYTGTAFAIKKDFAIQASPFQIVVANPSTTNVIILNQTTGKKLMFTDMSSTKTYEILMDYKDPYILESKILAMNRLNINSDWGDFKISPGDVISANVSITLNYMGVRI